MNLNNHSSQLFLCVEPLAMCDADEEYGNDADVFGDDVDGYDAIDVDELSGDDACEDDNPDEDDVDDPEDDSAPDLGDTTWDDFLDSSDFD